MYFGEIVQTGESNVPAEGPLLVAGNHSNGAVDGILIFIKFTRVVRFVAKEALFKIPIFGSFIGAVGTIPVLRPVDVKDPAKAGNSISSMFDRAVDALKEGSAICIFPEGKSHDGTHIITDKYSHKLKYGIGEMAMQAKCKDVPLKILPVGVHYSDKTHIRSSVFVSYGVPIDITAEDVGEYKQWSIDNPEGHVRDNSATLKLLVKIQEGIENVWLNAPDPETRSKAVLAHEVWSEKSAQKQGTSEPELWHTGVQYYVNLLAHNKCDPDGVKVDQKPARLVVDCLDEYHRVLDAWDTTNQDVAANRINFACVLFKSFGYFVLLVLSIPFLLPGLIIVAPIRIFAACIAAKVAKGIAKGDIEKGEQPEGYKADDVIGTIKIMVSMALVIILFPTYATVGCVLLKDSLGVHQAAWFFICLVGCMLIAIISVPFVDLATFACGKVAQTCKHGCCCGPEQMKLLKESHDKLRQALLDEKSRALQSITSDLESGKASDVVQSGHSEF